MSRANLKECEEANAAEVPGTGQTSENSENNLDATVLCSRDDYNARSKLAGHPSDSKGARPGILSTQKATLQFPRNLLKLILDRISRRWITALAAAKPTLIEQSCQAVELPYNNAAGEQRWLLRPW